MRNWLPHRASNNRDGLRQHDLVEHEARVSKVAEEQFFAEVLPRYQIVYGEGVGVALEGKSAFATATRED